MNTTWLPSGYILIAGPANSGKSSLFNGLTGLRLSPENPVPGTTRFPITGICRMNGSQACFIDSPPLEHDPDPRWLELCDAAVLVLDARHYSRDLGLAKVAGFMQQAVDKPVILALGHGDHIPAGLRAALALQASLETNTAGVVTVSPPLGDGVRELKKLAMSLLPMRERLFPEGITTLNSNRFLASEFVRSILHTVLTPEMADTTAVQIEEYAARNQKLYIRINIFVSRLSDKGSVIGRKGQTLALIQQETEAAVGQLSGLPVQMETWVKVREDWPSCQSDLLEFGYAH